MKQLLYGLLLIIVLGSCESEQERKKEKLKRIYTRL